MRKSHNRFLYEITIQENGEKRTRRVSKIAHIVYLVKDFHNTRFINIVNNKEMRFVWGYNIEEIIFNLDEGIILELIDESTNEVQSSISLRKL